MERVIKVSFEYNRNSKVLCNSTDKQIFFFSSKEKLIVFVQVIVQVKIVNRHQCEYFYTLCTNQYICKHSFFDVTTTENLILKIIIIK